MKCVIYRYKKAVDADIAFECWEINGGPFSIFGCPNCGCETLIPLQVIEETEKAEKKEICIIYNFYLIQVHDKNYNFL